MHTFLKDNIGILILCIYSCVLDRVSAQCDPCKTLVQKNFKPEDADCRQSACSPACIWQLFDLYWCVSTDSSKDIASTDQKYLLFTNSTFNDERSRFTSQCRNFIENGGYCEVKDLTPSIKTMRITNSTTQCKFCNAVVRQEFRPETLDCSLPLCTPGCVWRIIDQYWCAASNEGGQTYSLSTKTVAGFGSEFTRECSLFITQGGLCEVKDAEASVASDLPEIWLLFSLAVFLEISHTICIAFLQHPIRAKYWGKYRKGKLRRALHARQRAEGLRAVARLERQDADSYIAAMQAADEQDPDARRNLSFAAMIESRNARNAMLQAAYDAEMDVVGAQRHAADSEQEARRAASRLRKHTNLCLLSLLANAGGSVGKLFPLKLRGVCTTWSCAHLFQTAMMTLITFAFDAIERLLYLRVLAPDPPPPGDGTACVRFRLGVAGRWSRAAHKTLQVCVSLTWVLHDIAGAYPEAPGTGPLALGALACFVQIPLVALDARAVVAAGAAAREAEERRVYEEGRKSLVEVRATLGYVDKRPDASDSPRAQNGRKAEGPAP
jgi:hypothetical protein